ncbi:MAG: hypothetical protein ACOYOO_00520 [Saprospiraceae bacterium]|jgi:hypothetical protein
MRTIKTSLMRMAAMALAILTSASLLLHPGVLKAYDDQWVDPYDREYEDPLEGENKCGFLQVTQVCGRTASGGFAGWMSRNIGINIDGGGGYNTYYEKDCSNGANKTCEYRNDCKGSASRIVYYLPDCTIKIR